MAAGITNLGQLAGANPFWLDLYVGDKNRETFSQPTGKEAIDAASGLLPWYRPMMGSNPEFSETRFNFEDVAGITKERMFQIWDTIVTPDDPNTPQDETKRLTDADTFINMNPDYLSGLFGGKWTSPQIRKSINDLHAKKGLDPLTDATFAAGQPDDLTAVGMDETQANAAKNLQLFAYWQFKYWSESDLAQTFSVPEYVASQWKATARRLRGKLAGAHHPDDHHAAHRPARRNRAHYQHTANACPVNNTARRSTAFPASPSPSRMTTPHQPCPTRLKWRSPSTSAAAWKVSPRPSASRPASVAAHSPSHDPNRWPPPSPRRQPRTSWWTP